MKRVQPISKPWLAILDHFIDIGTKKVTVVLRVPIDALFQRGRAITLKDCECIGDKVSETVNGTSIAAELKNIFIQAGTSILLLKTMMPVFKRAFDCGLEKQEVVVPVIEDIGHVMATALLSQFEETKAYQLFTSWISQGAKCL